MVKAEGEILMISIYIDNFFLVSNSFKALAWLKDFLAKKYNIKNLGEIKIIIKWQVIKDLNTKMLKIDQLIFIYNLFKSENMNDYNSINILIKSRYFIDM